MAKRKLITDETRPLILGPRVRHEIELRVRELTARREPTIYDLAELVRLQELLNDTEGRQ